MNNGIFTHALKRDRTKIKKFAVETPTMRSFAFFVSCSVVSKTVAAKARPWIGLSLKNRQVNSIRKPVKTGGKILGEL